MREILAAAIVDHLDKHKIPTPQITQRYASVRAGDIQRLRRGELLGFKMMSAIAEAIGLKFKFEVKP